MKKNIYKILILIISIHFLSCNNNDDDVEINDFKGFYKIKSIYSNIPIDLNNDGLRTTDYLQEIKSNYISYNGEIINFRYDNEERGNFAQARPTKYESNNTQFLDICFPIQSIDSIYQGNNDFVMMNMTYKKIGTNLIYKLTNNNVVIESDPFNHYEFWGINNFEINRLSKEEFEINFGFKVYDFTEDDWSDTILNAKYIKVEE